ncbi:MAG: PRC-barrel domain-containing protein [Gemmatimonadaceae bacterium]|nr:PRC-barrel domain-containing protein [Gemmatimonadaceae bacterium]
MARLDDRGGRDAAGTGPYHRPDSDLVPLRELADWTLNDGEPDIRGWEVSTVGGRAIGTVRELLVDRKSGEVVLLDLDLVGGDRRARAPIRAVQIDRTARIVRMDSAEVIEGASLAATADGDDVRASDDARLRSERVVDSDRDRDADADADLDRDFGTQRELLADGTEETVVDRRPVVYEEVVVRRRPADPDATESTPDRLAD